MRVSVIKEDPGYKEWTIRCKVFLDGDEISRCFTADEEKGEVHCYATYENGRVVLDPDNPMNITTTVRKGKVWIELPGELAVAYDREKVEEKEEGKVEGKEVSK